MSRPTLRGPALFALLLALPFPGSAAAQDTSSPFVFGTHAFRRMLYEKGYTALEAFEQIKDPGNTLLIVLGDLDAVNRLPDGLVEFVRQGGTVLLASDRRPQTAADRTIQKLAGVHISGEILTCPNQERCFHKLTFCPFLEPAANTTPNLFGSAANVRSFLPGLGMHVATNNPSSLTVERRVSVLAGLPAECTSATEAGVVKNSFLRRLLESPRNSIPFAVGGQRGAGRFLILADHSVFINEMMLRDDNDNIVFADNCLSWLEHEKRNSQVLFVENSAVRSILDVPVRPVNIDANRVLAQVGERLVELGKEDAYNRALLEQISPVPDVARRQVFKSIFAGLTAIMVLYLVYRVGVRARFYEDPALPRLEGAVQKHTPELALLAQRELAVLAAGNFAELARALARQCFAALGCPASSGSAALSAPRIEAVGNWWGRRRWMRCVKRLWTVATGPAPARVSAGACRSLIQDARRLQDAVARGAVRLVGNPS